MKFIYLANLRLPTEKAYGIQIASMCEAFAHAGIEVELVMPTRSNEIVDSVSNYYGAKGNFRERSVPSPDFYWPGALERVAVGMKSAISAWRLVHTVMREKPDTIYSRDELPIYLASFSTHKLAFEAHTFSPSRSFFYRRFRKKNIPLIAISQGVADDFIAYGISPDRILVAHDAVDHELFKPQPMTPFASGTRDH